MPSKPTFYSQKRFSGGIADYRKENANGTIPDSFYFGRAINYRDDPQQLTLLPASLKESGSVVTDLLKWGDITPFNLASYFYGNSGNIYTRSETGSWQNLNAVPNSHGNGLSFFSGDGYLYYTADSVIGRYGPVANASTIIEDWHSLTISPTLWNDNSSGAASAASGQLVITQAAHSLAYPSVYTSTFYDLTNTRLFTQVVSAGNQSLAPFECIFLLYVSPGNEIYITINSNIIDARKIVGGVNSSVSTIAYNSAVHKYLGISLSNGVISYETSQDGVSYTTFASVANPLPTTMFQAGMQVGFSSDVASSTSATFDDFGTGPVATPPQFSNNFLAAAGGVPGNTASFALLSSGSQYLAAADSASLSQTGDITLESFFKSDSLPTVGNSMVLMGKWNETGNLRSYLLDLYGVSGYFGDGSDGALTISSNTTEAPIDSVCTGITGDQLLTATNASFAAGQVIQVWQTQGTNHGQWERNTIQGYTAGTITLGTPLIGSYVTGAQVRVLKQYTNVTIDNGFTYTAKAWTGTVGGELAFLYNGSFTNNGTVTATGCGFRGATTSVNPGAGVQGEGYLGAGTGAVAANGNGGGAGIDTQNSAGGGGGLGTAGTDGGGASPISRGKGGLAAGSADLTTLDLGGGGGSCRVSSSAVGNGGDGGGAILIFGVTFTNNGTISSNGVGGLLSSPSNQVSGGSGSAGPILIRTQAGTNNGTIVATGGVSQNGSLYTGGPGGVGRIHADYLNIFSNLGTITPALDSAQDNTLVTTTTIQARLGISDNGTSFEYLTKNLATLTTGTWNRLSVSWDASASLATFYLNAVPIGTSTGTKTAISNNASSLYVGAINTTVPANFFNGKLDDIRIWGNVQSAGQIFANNEVQLTGSEGGLQAYWEANNALTDSTGNANTLTNHSTTYSTDVPFPAATTRLDIDQTQSATGDTYALKTAISELAVDMLDFTPQNDPQASVSFEIAAKGTGAWTVYVHDQQNNLIASKTISNANLATAGIQEFIYDTPWRLVTGKQYHMHLTSTVADGTIVSNVNNDLQSAAYTTYFGYLVPDAQYHPAVQFQYQPLGGVLTGAEIFGNGPYLAVWDGANYIPNFITFPPQWKVRCFAFWREFLVVGVWRGGNIYDFDQGRLYFWDGIAPTWNFYIPVPEGQVNAMYGVASDLYIYAGYRGQLLDYQVAYSYSNGNSRSTKIKRMPLISPTDYTEVLPGAMTFWRGLLYSGLFGASNSETMQRGIYSFGTQNQLYPETLGYDHVISTGNTGSTVTIGCVFPVGQTLVVGWQDGISFGADQINFNNAAASSGEIQLLLQDDGQIWHQSANFTTRVDYLPIETGEAVDAKFSLDRDTFVTSPQTAADIFSKLTVIAGRGREYMIGANITSTSGTSPTVLGITLQRNPLTEEQSM